MQPALGRLLPALDSSLQKPARADYHRVQRVALINAYETGAARVRVCRQASTLALTASG
jgi:hypothetical protein